MENKKRSFTALRNGDLTIYMIAPYDDSMDEDLSDFDYPEAAYKIGPDGEILGSYGDGILYDDDGNIIIGNDDISDYVEPIILDDNTIPVDYLDEKLLNDERNRILLRRQGGVFSKGGSIINNSMGLYKHGGYLMPRKFKDGGAVGKYLDPAGPLDKAIDYLDKFTNTIPVVGTVKKGAKKVAKKIAKAINSDDETTKSNDLNLNKVVGGDIVYPGMEGSPVYPSGYSEVSFIDDNGNQWLRRIDPTQQDTVYYTPGIVGVDEDAFVTGSKESHSLQNGRLSRKKYEERQKLVESKLPESERLPGFSRGGRNVRSHGKGGIAVKVDRGNGIEGYVLANREDINWVRNQEGRYVPLLKEFAKGGRVGKFQKGLKTPNKTQMMPLFEMLTPEQVKEIEDRDKLWKSIEQKFLGKTIEEIIDEWVKKEREATKRKPGPDDVITLPYKPTPLPNAIVGEEPNIVLYQNGDKLPYNIEDANSFIARIRDIMKNGKTSGQNLQEPKTDTPDNDRSSWYDRFGILNDLNVPNVVEGTEQSGNTLQSGWFNEFQRRLLNNNR